MRRFPLVAAALCLAAPAFAQPPGVRLQLPTAPTLTLYLPEQDSRGRLYYSITSYTDPFFAFPNFLLPPIRSQATYQAYDNIYAQAAALQSRDQEPPAGPPPIDPYAVKLTLEVPETSEVWVEGQKLEQAGATRTVVSAPLPEGRQFEYAVRVRWHDGKKMVVKQLKVPVQAGDRPIVFVTGYESAK